MFGRMRLNEVVIEQCVNGSMKILPLIGLLFIH
jgi:hypothetical protein